MVWQEEFEQKLNNEEIQTDSDIEDFIEDYKYAYYKKTHNKLVSEFKKDVWNYFYQWRVRGTPCEGCVHAKFRFCLIGIESECMSCLRRTKYKDNYERI